MNNTITLEKRYKCALALHGAFGVGKVTPRDIPALIGRGVELLAACRQHEAELSTQGWGARQNAALATAVRTLDESYQAVQVSNDTRLGLTARQRKIGNALYQQCQALQGVVRYLYPTHKIAERPTIVRARARFLIGEFPRRTRPSTDAAAEPSPAPIVESSGNPRALAEPQPSPTRQCHPVLPASKTTAPEIPAAAAPLLSEGCAN